MPKHSTDPAKPQAKSRTLHREVSTRLPAGNPLKFERILAYGDVRTTETETFKTRVSYMSEIEKKMRRFSSMRDMRPF